MTHDSKLARRLAEAAQSIGSATDEGLTAERVCQLAVDLIPACDHASVTVRQSKRFVTLASTSELATRLDAAQYDLDEGPCVEAAETGDPLVSQDLGADGRWPRWAPLAAEEGAGSLMAIPLEQDTVKVGAMNFYSHRSEPWGDEDEEIACLYAIHASALLAAAHEIAGLRTALGSRHRIGMAQGVLMRQYALTPEAAFAVLHRTSNEENRKLVDVVDDIIAGVLPG